VQAVEDAEQTTKPHELHKETQYMRMTLAQFVVGSLVLGATIAASIGCGGSGGGSSSGMGTLSMSLADAPDPSTSAVNVTIDKVEANVDGNWQQINTATPAFSGDLLTLAKTTSPLGTTQLPTGHYTQVRLFVSSATLTDSTGTHDVTIPSGSQTGLKVLVDYDINAGDVTNVLLDFDVNHSIVSTGSGKFMLKPVVRGSVQVLSGTVTGTVVDGSGAVQGATVTLTPSGQAPSATDPSVLTLSDGTFKVWGVMPSTYDVNVTFTPSGGSAETGSATNEAVTANANTDTGTITLS
jgi:hypothetical protein